MMEIQSTTETDVFGTNLESSRTNKKRKRENRIRYPCDQCTYNASKLSNLNQHKNSEHEGIRYPCDQCDSSFSRLSHLKRHKESLHEGIRYTCDHCTYDASQLSILNDHKKSVHEEITNSNLGRVGPDSDFLLSGRIRIVGHF